MQGLNGIITFFGSIDIGLLKFINGFSNGPLDNVFILITDLGLPFLWIIIAIIEIFRNRKREGAFIILALVFNIMFNTLLKYFFLRPRPNFTYHPDGIESSPSFPSGHTTVAFAGATSYAQLESHNKKISTLLYLLAFLIGLSRMYLGQHFPSDVLFGGLFSYFLTLVLALICGKMHYIAINQQSWIWKVQNKLFKIIIVFQSIKVWQSISLSIVSILTRIRQLPFINLLPLVLILLGIIGGFISFMFSYIVNINTLTYIFPIFIFDPEGELITTQSIQQELNEWGIYIMIFTLILAYISTLLKKQDLNLTQN